MANVNPQILETIVNTLLQVGGRVLEVSSDYEVIREWNRLEENSKLSVVENSTIVTKCGALIAASLNEQRNEESEYSIIFGDSVFKYKIRVLPIHPYNENHVFLVVEFVSRKRAGRVTEDYWMLALDAAGDGMWDVNNPECNILFSEKWYKTFGYENGKISTLAQFTSIIHPDDIEKVDRVRTDYFESNVRFYSSEFRIRCANGEYKWVHSRGVVVARSPDGTPLRFTGTHTDITSRKSAEESYYSIAQLLSKLINNLREGILVTDEDRNIVFANQAFCDLYLLETTPDSFVGTSVIRNLEERMAFYDEPELFFTRALGVMENQELVLGEEWRMADGRVLSRDYIPLVLGKDNKGGIWKFKDITFKKNAEKEIADLHRFYEKILNNVPAEIAVYDPKFRYTFINPNAVKNKEVRTWMIGKTDWEYCEYRNKPIELAARRAEMFKKALNDKVNVQWEEMLVNIEGSTEYHLRNHQPLFDDDGKHLMSIGFGFSITDRVMAKQELKTSRDTFASAFNDSGIGMALLSRDGVWLDANSVMCTITGYSKLELQRLRLQDITHPDDRKNDIEYLEKIFSKDISTYSIEKRFISGNSKVILVMLTVSLVWDAHNTPKFFIVQAVDITDKMAMEWELRKKNTELETTKENLLYKINQLEDLSHIIAHNLRGPAGNIKMLSETMLGKQSGSAQVSTNQLEELFTLDEALVLIHDSSKSLMDSLTTLMQITEIKLNTEIARDECNIDKIVNDMCNQLQSKIFEKQAKITKHFDVPVVSYPLVYLENIFYNLVSNALKYTRKDVPPEIDIITELKDGRVQITVKDNGLGIDMERYGSRVFRLNEVFHQGFESKGVGLYITKTQVESFGGKIELKGKPSEGCEFIVTL